MSLWFELSAPFLAMGLGAMHALVPGSRVLGTLSPWLGVFFGLIITGLGGYPLLRRWSGFALDHAHAPGERHSHWFAFAAPRLPGMRTRGGGPLTIRWLPLASAAFLTILGAAVTVRAFLMTGLDVHHLSKEKLGPFLFIAVVGLLLGMRHSTDPDHVVAVSTIVSKQRSIRQAGLIGSIWGLGHTLTIFAVGSLIILFGVVIPPRLGLSMEFSVALMLILLGVMNLTGLMQRLTTSLTHKGDGPASVTATDTLLDRSIGRLGVYQYVRPLVIGIVHGLAGSAAVALLVLSTIHSPLWATLYLLIFGAGTMVGMMCMTAAMAVPLAFAGTASNR